MDAARRAAQRLAAGSTRRAGGARPVNALKILISGTLAGVPGQGGAAWAVLQYALGLQRLGHELLLVEQVDRLEPAAPRFLAIARRFGLNATMIERGSGRTAGQAGPVEADLLLNLSGVLT